MIVNGFTFHTEGTGGGCEAHVCPIDGGVLVLTDGQAFTDYEGTGEAVAAIFVGDAWMESNEPTRYAVAATPAEAVAAVLA